MSRTNHVLQKLNGFIKDVNAGNTKDIIKNLQLICDYQAEKLRIYEEKIQEATGKARPQLTDSDRRRLAQKGRVLNDYVLSIVEPTWSVRTVRGWYNTLVGDKYNSVRPNQKKRGAIRHFC